jgi:DNA polymerase elongation subunit (family B)
LFGAPLEKIEFSSIKEAKSYVESYGGISGGIEVYGNTSYSAQFMYDLSNEFDKNLLNVIFIDIETEIIPEKGIPRPDSPDNEILLVSAFNRRTGKGTVFGAKPFSGELPDGWKYEHCHNEHKLLKLFVEYLNTNQADIISGWNTDLFDNPYLFARMKRVLGEDVAKFFSPWGIVFESTETLNGTQLPTVRIAGVSQLDLMKLYKKYTDGSRESFSLSFISEYEDIETKKHDYSDLAGGFRELYEHHWDRFVLYNVDDVRAVVGIDRKLNLIDLHTYIAYMAKENFEDAFSPVRTWENIIFNYLKDRNIEFDPVKESPSRSYEGGYVHTPEIGLYGWTCNVDATSLYPSVIMSLNISPETLVGKANNVAVDSILQSNDSFATKYPNHCIAANGAVFRRDKEGIIPHLVDTMFQDRTKTKKAMLKLENQKEKLKSSGASLKQVESVEEQIAPLNTKQNALKKLLNSLYGAMANKYFRYYNVDLAEAITLTGQMIVKNVIKVLPNVLDQYGVKSVYGDTDSVFFNIDGYAKQHCSGDTAHRTVEKLEQFILENIQPAISKIVEHLFEKTGVYQNKISFKLEGIGDKFLIVGKKHYAMRLHYKEGVYYDTPKLKIMGLELIKSTTPKGMRNLLKEGLECIISGEQHKFYDYVKKSEVWFREQPIEKISFISGVNGVEKYADSDTLYKKGCPIHVRASLVYNQYTAKEQLDRVEFPQISNGDKVKYCYLTMPNFLHENVVATPRNYPQPLTKSYDYDTMWEKMFVNNLKDLAKAAGLSIYPKPSLDDFF